MGWYGYTNYSGDDTQTLHYDFISWAGAGKEQEILEGGWLKFNKTIIPKEKLSVFVMGFPKIFKKMPKVKFWNEEKAIKWQMLLHLYFDNNLFPPVIVLQNGLAATEYLCGEHCNDFVSPKTRRAHLKNFIKRVARKYKIKLKK